MSLRRPILSVVFNRFTLFHFPLSGASGLSGMLAVPRSPYSLLKGATTPPSPSANLIITFVICKTQMQKNFGKLIFPKGKCPGFFPSFSFEFHIIFLQMNQVFLELRNFYRVRNCPGKKEMRFFPGCDNDCFHCSWSPFCALRSLFSLSGAQWKYQISGNRASA